MHRAMGYHCHVPLERGWLAYIFDAADDENEDDNYWIQRKFMDKLSPFDCFPSKKKWMAISLSCGAMAWFIQMCKDDRTLRREDSQWIIDERERLDKYLSDIYMGNTINWEETLY